METFAFSIVLFALAMLAMASGVILGGRRLRGSCGGPGGEACACSLAERMACIRRGRQGASPPTAD